MCMAAATTAAGDMWSRRLAINWQPGLQEGLTRYERYDICFGFKSNKQVVDKVIKA